MKTYNVVREKSGYQQEILETGFSSLELANRRAEKLERAHDAEREYYQSDTRYPAEYFYFAVEVV